jgi:hypothetical protein
VQKINKSAKILKSTKMENRKARKSPQKYTILSYYNLSARSNCEISWPSGLENECTF